MDGAAGPLSPSGLRSWKVAVRTIVLLFAVLLLAPVVGAESLSAAQVTGSSSDTLIATAENSGTAWVVFATDTVVAEIANTAEERAQGLMHRESVPDGTGMLFVFGGEARRSFWMQNTRVALDVAFMDAAWEIVDIQQMEAETTNAHTSKAPAMYALEVPKGWFASHGVEVGMRAQVTFRR